MRDRGVSLAQSPSSVFISILDLLLLSYIPEYAVKKELFLDLYRGLSIHNPALSFPTLPEGYFASLPSTRADDATIHLLLSKKQMSLSLLEGIPKDIAATIVNTLTNRKAGTKSIYVSSVPVDYCAYRKENGLISRMQLQQQFLTEREVTGYVLHPSAAQRQINSNIYGHGHRTTNNLQSTVFKQFWELLPDTDKHGILTMEFKDILCQARESIYWFVIRYVLLNWDTLIPAVNPLNVIREGSLFYIDVKKINQQTLSVIIDAASAYDTAIEPSPSSSSSLFSEDLSCESSSFDDMLSTYCIERFRLFFYWLLCDRMDYAFQMHQKEEEADRVAASLLSEDISTNENGKRKKKKKRAKKKEVDNSTYPLSEVKTVIGQKAAKQIQAKVNAGQADLDMVTVKTNSKQIDMVKPSEDHSVSVKPSGLTPISVNTQSQLPEEVPEMKRRVTRPDLLRINRFLLGERREKSDFAPLPERKRTRETHQTRPFVSLRQVLLRPDPLSMILDENRVSLPISGDTLILPPEDAVIHTILNQSPHIETEIIDPPQEESSSIGFSMINNYEDSDEYSKTPSQLLQQTLQQSIPEAVNW